MGQIKNIKLHIVTDIKQLLVMATNVFRIVRSSIRCLPRLAGQQVRNDGIFTKYREPPNGFLFNRKPLKPGEKREREDWELIWYVGWGSAFVLLCAGSYFRPQEGLLD